LGLKTPSAFFPLPHTGHTDAQLVTDRQACDLISSSADSPKQSVQYSKDYRGRDVAQTMGVVSIPLSTEDEKQYTHLLFPPQVSIGQPNQTVTHARDGTFVSQQQAHEIAFSTQVPVGSVSQHSKAFDITREAPNEATGKKHAAPSYSSEIGVDISGENKKTAGDEVRASRHLEGVSFSTEIKAVNVQTTEPISGHVHRNGPSVLGEYITTVGNRSNGAHSFEGCIDKPTFPCLQQGSVSGSNFLKDGYMSAEHNSYDVAYSSHSLPLNSGVHIASKESSVSEYPNSIPGFRQTEDSGVIPQDAKFFPFSTSILGQVVHSIPIAGDSMPKSALVMQQRHLTQEQPELATTEHELAGKLEQLTGMRISFQFINIVCYGSDSPYC
jgi:hypothetical protein